MNNTLALNYYLKALDNYPWSIPEVMEALDYALSYDNEFAESHVLMGKLFVEQLRNYEEAKVHYNRAIACDINCKGAFEGLLELAVILKDEVLFKKAMKHYKKLLGVYPGQVFYYKFMIAEKSKQFEKAKRMIKRAISETLNRNDLDYYKAELKRLKEKLKV